MVFLKHGVEVAVSFPAEGPLHNHKEITRILTVRWDILCSLQPCYNYHQSIHICHYALISLKL